MAHNLSVIVSPFCNLRCRYCKITHAKQEALKRFDEDLIKSFENDGQYYFDMLDKIDKGVSKYNQLSLCGGEPLYRDLNFCFGFIGKFFKKSQATYLFISTNFCSTNALDNLKALVEFLDSLGQKIIFVLQISLDGPFSNETRGPNVKDTILKNIKILFKNNAYLKKNSKVNLHIQTKASLDIEHWSLLINEDRAIDYFLFYDNIAHMYHTYTNTAYKNKILLDIQKNNARVVYTEPWTQQNGFDYAQVLRTTLNLRNKDYKKLFRYIIPSYYNVELRHIKSFLNKPINYKCTFCDFGPRISILPNNIMNLCTIDFYDWYGKGQDPKKLLNPISSYEELEIYKPNVGNNMFCRSIEEYYTLLINTNAIYTYERALLSQYIAAIKFLASMGQVDKKYLNMDDFRIKIVLKCMEKIIPTHCFQDHWSISGSILSPINASLKLCLNGAVDILLSEAEHYG